MLCDGRSRRGPGVDWSGHGRPAASRPEVPENGDYKDGPLLDVLVGLAGRQDSDNHLPASSLGKSILGWLNITSDSWFDLLYTKLKPIVPELFA